MSTTPVSSAAGAAAADANAVDLSRVHMVGIGGAGMSGLARILIDRGSVVTGSDMKDSTPVEALRAAGAKIAVGHSADNLELSGQGLPTVVVTSFAAIPQDNPELQGAKANGIPVIRRSDLLALLMESYDQILLAGTHGKTSTTSMTVSALQTAGLDPSFAIGGQLNRAGTNAHHGTGTAFVAEADESDASLLRYTPKVAVVTNVEPDHLDYFKTAEAYFQVFDDFADRVREDGTLVVCLDDDNAAALGERAVSRGVNVLGYGTQDAATRHPQMPAGAIVRAESVTETGTHVEAEINLAGVNDTSDASTTISYELQIPGHHMVLNSLAAVLAGVLCGAELEALATGLTDFGGVRRRFEYRGTAGEGVRVYDDYAHHPTEVRAVLGAAQEKVTAEAAQQGLEARRARVVAAFQPHLYSRTMEFAQEFADALSLADEVILLDIYGAREQPVEGVDSRIISTKMTRKLEEAPESVIFEPDFSAAPATIVSRVQPGDLVLTIGAGSVTLLAAEILRELGGENAYA